MFDENAGTVAVLNSTTTLAISAANTRTSDYQYCQTEPDGVRFLGYGPTMSHVVQTSLNYFLETAQSDPNPEDKLLNKKRWPLLYFHLDNMTVQEI